MSDMNIPGVSGNRGIDSQKTIEELMKAERRPLDRMENETEDYQEEKQVWQDLRRSAQKLSENARDLYGAQSPFSSRTADSSDESVLTATAQRGAPESRNEIEVLQTAGADKFLSSPVSTDTRIPEGRYGFRVGDEEAFFDFGGGNLESFAEAVNRSVDDLVQVRVVKDSQDTQVIAFNSQITGAENRLEFLEQAEETALELGVIERSRSGAREIAMDDGSLAPWESPISEDTVRVTDETLELRPGGPVSLPVTPEVQDAENMVLELEVRMVDRSEEAEETPSPPSGPEIPDAGALRFEDITIPYPRSEMEMPEFEEPEEPRIETDDRVLFARSGGEDVPLPRLSPGEEFETVQIPLGEHVDSIDALNLRNENTHRDFYIRNARIYDPDARGEYEPVNPVETAADARVKLDGITVTRDSNEIDDLIPGTTLELQAPSQGPVSLEVGPDLEPIKESVIGFLSKYNEFVADLNILTRREEGILEEISYLEGDEREQAKERLGMLQGDSGLNQMRSRLQQIMMNSYPTDAGQELNMLAQMGISTNASGANTGSVDSSRLRGYLEMDEEQFDAALEDNLDAVKQLFGSDSDGDMRMDEGVAYRVEEYMRPAVQSGGFFQNRQGSLDSRIARTEDDMSDYSDHLDRYEQRLRREFGEVEEAMDEMDRNERALERLNRSSPEN